MCQLCIAWISLLLRSPGSGVSPGQDFGLLGSGTSAATEGHGTPADLEGPAGFCSGRRRGCLLLLSDSG
jgi:hypothetical protein